MLASTSRAALRGSLRTTRSAAFSTSAVWSKDTPVVVELLQDVEGIGYQYDRVAVAPGRMRHQLAPCRLARYIPWKRASQRLEPFISEASRPAPSNLDLLDAPSGKAPEGYQHKEAVPTPEALLNALHLIPQTITFERRTVSPSTPALHGSLTLSDVLDRLVHEHGISAKDAEVSWVGQEGGARMKELGTWAVSVQLREFGREEVRIEVEVLPVVVGSGAPNVPTMPTFATRGFHFSLTPAVQRLLIRGTLLVTAVLLCRSLFFSSPKRHDSIQTHGVVERVFLQEKELDVSKYPFLQSRIGRDSRPDLFDEEVTDGIWDFWTRFQQPFIAGSETAHEDTQVMKGVIDDLLQFNGWVAAKCQTLVRPFSQSVDDKYNDLANTDHLYYIALVVHSADHFLVDQLAIIVQLARRLGTRHIFVSMLDQGSTDATPTLSDLCEAVLTILGIAFRIRRIDPLTITYYPLEEAAVRNLVLEPLHELQQKRNIKFHRVIWLKGFTCPMDVLESLRVSEQNSAAMVCGMDWAEHNGFFIFSDRWRTRDIAGDLFRQARSSSKPEAGPPRDKVGTERYAEHLPFQVFCCESGTHVVDPEQSYYRGIKYRASPNAQNLTADVPTDPETPCMDSTQMWFCRDLWIDASRGTPTEGKGRRGAARSGRRSGKRDVIVENIAPILGEADPGPNAAAAAGDKKRADKPAPAAGKEHIERPADREAAIKAAENEDPAAQPANPVKEGQDREEAADENSGTNIDAMDDTIPAPEPIMQEEDMWLIPNSEYRPARILVNPRCLTTYGGVSHTQLALDLFGDRDRGLNSKGRYSVDDWAGAPDSFVCQEMRTTGGRTAPKSQRRVSFILQNELENYPQN
ncbi:uncharacterized protein LOC62_02G002327 [Vanrija pseudolonga]|uniref:Ribosomal protein L9 domain-containing protein n=1 Tax=Vanrija pseudolonga TaxID=143232 RepID=A0AAF0Y637_9TREE|nr:hypothetical protein LOC62_02G002327 [Vanrija pseudolonga]